MSFPIYPYTNFHELNADWLLKTVKQAAADAAEAAENAANSAETVETYNTRLTAVESGLSSLQSDFAGAVRFDEEQELTNIQQTQARANIGAASGAQIAALGETTASLGSRCTALETNSVSYTAQSKTSTEKAQARSNIYAASVADVTDVVHDLQSLASIAVRVNGAQSFTDAQKLQARQNIGAASADATPSGVVLYSSTQSLSDTERARARSNIAALGEYNPVASETFGIMDDSVALSDGDEITLSLDSTPNHSILKLEGDQSTFVRISGVADPYENDQAATKGYCDDSYEAQWKLSPVTGSTPSITPADHTIFECGECSTLTVSTPLADEFVVIFDSGSTATILSLAAAIIMPADFEVNANTHYELNIRKTWGLYAAWEIEVTP